MSGDKNNNTFTVKSHGNMIENNKRTVSCNHKGYGMFYMCHLYDVDHHLHCISCGKILVNDITLNTAVRNSRIFRYRYACEKLYDHLT